MISCLQGNLEDYAYRDLLRSEMQYRNLITMIHVFSYGFIMLISLICVCNVFHTISTNIALRRMLLLECARYGIRSLLWGLPIGIGAGFGIYLLMVLGNARSYRFPWLTVCIAIGAVFVIVFISMQYAVTRLKQDNPIHAIRADIL